MVPIPLWFLRAIRLLLGLLSVLALITGFGWLYGGVIDGLDVDVFGLKFSGTWMGLFFVGQGVFCGVASALGVFRMAALAKHLRGGKPRGKGEQS